MNGDDPKKKPKPKPVPVEELLGPDEPLEGARRPVPVEELLGGGPEAVQPPAGTPAQRRPPSISATKPATSPIDLAVEGFKRLTDPEEHDPTEGSGEFMGVPRAGAPPRPASDFQPPAKIPTPKFDQTGLPIYNPEETAAVAEEQAHPETKAPADAVNYRDPAAVAQYTAHWKSIAEGKTMKPDGSAYSHQDREQARALWHNLNTRMNLEESKGGFGRRYVDRLGSYVPPGLSFLAGQTNADSYRKIREAQETGDLPNQDDVKKFGRPWKGSALRTEPTFFEGMKEEALPAMAGDVTAMVLSGEGRFLTAGGEAAAEIGSRGVGAALRRAAAGKAPGSMEAFERLGLTPGAARMARIGQRVVAGGVPGAGVGAMGDYAETRARGGGIGEAATAAGTNAALGFGLGATMQVGAGALLDALGPTISKWASRIAAASPIEIRNSPAIIESLLREQEAKLATAAVNNERTLAGKLPLTDLSPEAHLRAISDALDQILADKQAVQDANPDVIERRRRWAEHRRPLTEEEERRADPNAPRPVWTPEEREAFHAQEVEKFKSDPWGVTPPTHPDVMEERFRQGRTQKFPWQLREEAEAAARGEQPGAAAAPPWRPTEQADMSLNMERIEAERKAAELAAVQQARAEAEGGGAAAASTAAAEPPGAGPAIPPAIEEGGRQALPAVAAVASDQTDNDDTKNLLALAGTLASGKEGDVLHEGQRFFSRLEKHIKGLPPQWDKPRTAGEWMEKLKSGGAFSKEEYNTVLRPALEAEVEKSKAPTRKTWTVELKNGSARTTDNPLMHEAWKEKYAPEIASGDAKIIEDQPGSWQRFENGELMAQGDDAARRRWEREKAQDEAASRNVPEAMKEADRQAHPVVEIRPLERTGKLTRADVLDMMKEHGIQLDETRYSASGKDITPGREPEPEVRPPQTYHERRADIDEENDPRGPFPDDYEPQTHAVREEYQQEVEAAQAEHDSAEEDLRQARDQVETAFDRAGGRRMRDLHSAMSAAEGDEGGFDVDQVMNTLREDAFDYLSTPQRPDQEIEGWKVYYEGDGKYQLRHFSGDADKRFNFENEYEALVALDKKVGEQVPEIGNLRDILDDKKVVWNESEETFDLVDDDGDVVSSNTDRDDLINEYVQDNYEPDLSPLDDLHGELQAYADAHSSYYETESNTYQLREGDMSDDDHWMEKLNEAREADQEAMDEHAAAVADDPHGQPARDPHDPAQLVLEPGATTPEGVPSTQSMALEAISPLRVAGKSKFTTYQRVPGGKNYREILISWANKLGEAFKEGHWDLENVLAHLRMTEHEYRPIEPQQRADLEDVIRRRTELGQQQGDIARRYNEMTTGPFEYNDEQRALAAEYARVNDEVQKVEGEYTRIKANIEARPERRNTPVERTLNAFEHQSDWKQQGEERGYAVMHSPEILAQTRKELEKSEERRLALVAEKDRIINQVTEQWRERMAIASADHEALREQFYDSRPNAPDHDSLKTRYRAAGDRLRLEERAREEALDNALDDVRSRLGTLSDLMVTQRAALEPTGLPDMPFKQPADVFALTTARMLHEAADGNYDRVAWSTAENRKELAGLSLAAGKITYDQSVVGATKKLLKGLGFGDAKIEKIELDGYSHWSVKLTPEMRAKIKKFGFPLLGALATTATAAESAEAQDGTHDKPSRFIPIAAGLLAAGVLVVKHAALRKGAVKAFEYFEAKGGEAALKKLDVRNVRGRAEPKLLTPEVVGDMIGRANLKDGVPYIRVPKEQIYDVSADPHGLVAKLVKAYGTVDPGKLEEAIQRAGFVAYRVTDGEKPGVKLIGAPGEPPIPARVARAIDRFNESDEGKVYSNPLGPALSALRRSPTAASLAVLGLAADRVDEKDDRNIHRMSKPLIGLAALTAIGSKNLAKGGGLIVKTLVDQLARTESGKAVTRFISPALLLPPEINRGLEVREGAIAKGRARGKEFGKMARDLGPVGDREVSDVLEGEDWEGLNGPTVAGVMSVAQAHEAEYARLTAEQVRSGTLAPERVIEGYGGPRKYAEYEALDVWKSDETTPRSSGRRIQETKARTLDIPIHDAERALDEAIQSGNTADIAAARDKLDEAQVNQLGARLDRGEIRESSYRIESHIPKVSQDVANADFFHLASTTPGMVHPEFKARLDEFLDARREWKAATNPQDRAIWLSLMDDRKLAMDDISRRYQTQDPKWATLPDSPGLGVLRGMVVDKALHGEVAGVPEKLGIDKVMNFWKQAHTVFNPGTNLANILSNIPILHLAGVPIWEQPKWLTLAHADMGKYGEASRALTEAGIFDVNFANASAQGEQGLTAGKEQALRELVKTTRPETADVLRRRSVGLVDRTNTVGEKVSKPLDWVRGVYNSEDNHFRAALFLKRRAEGASIEEATRAAREEFGNFRTRSPLLSVLRRSISPFVLWPLKVLPPVAKNVVDHPYRYLTLVALGAALDEYSKHEVGEIPEEDIAEQDRRKWGYFFPGFTQLPMKDTEGRRSAIDIGRWTPFSNATDIANPGSTGAALDERFPRILTPSGPGADLWNIASNNYDRFTGQARYSDTEGKLGVAGEIAKDLAQTVAPPALGFHLPRVLTDLANADPAKAATDALGFLGARPRYTEPGQVEFRARLQYEKDMLRINQELRRNVNASRNPARTDRLFEDADKKRDRAVSKYERATLQNAPPPAP